VTVDGGRTTPAPTLPMIDILDGNAVTLDICEPCWLYAGRITELEGEGLSWPFVYRSTWLRASDAMCQRMLDHIGGAIQIGSQVLPDPEMVWGQGELALYEPRTDLAVQA
jgi:hypothetical protein